MRQETHYAGTLREFMRECGYTQTGLAAATGIAASTINRLFHARRTRPETRERLRLELVKMKEQAK